MVNRMYIDMIIAREKQRALLCQAERDLLIRLVQVGRETRVRAGRRAWDRLTCWLCQYAWIRVPIVVFALGLPVNTCSMCSLATGKDRVE